MQALTRGLLLHDMRTACIAVYLSPRKPPDNSRLILCTPKAGLHLWDSHDTTASSPLFSNGPQPRKPSGGLPKAQCKTHPKSRKGG